MNIHPHIETLGEAENLFTAGVLDSLILIQFVLALEDHYQIRLANEDITYDQFQSFESISELLRTKYKKS
jgi:acyl carrier protein